MTPLDLVGTWHFHRVVDDRHAGETIQVEGIAVFRRADDGTIAWEERGTMHLASGGVAVETHRVLRADTAGSWTVDFADGRGFHPWATGQELVHDCAPDLYRGRLDPEPVGTWAMRWTATGPTKDYTIDTTYRRPDGV
jgi:hypothetical protein